MGGYLRISFWGELPDDWSTGLPEKSEDSHCAESVLLYLFYVCEAASLFLLKPQTAVGKVR